MGSAQGVEWLLEDNAKRFEKIVNDIARLLEKLDIGKSN